MLGPGEDRLLVSASESARGERVLWAFKRHLRKVNFQELLVEEIPRIAMYIL